MSIYILSFEDGERVTSVLGPFSDLKKAQGHAEDDNNAPLRWGQADPSVFKQETWMTDEGSMGEYYTIEKFEMDPEFVPPMEAIYTDADIPAEWPPIDPATGLRPPPVFGPWKD